MNPASRLMSTQLPQWMCFFPVDKRGTADISCHQCPYLSSNERMCQLNKEPTAYPNKYVGGKCPLKITNNMEANENESI